MGGGERRGEMVRREVRGTLKSSAAPSSVVLNSVSALINACIPTSLINSFTSCGVWAAWAARTATETRRERMRDKSAFVGIGILLRSTKSGR